MSRNEILKTIRGFFKGTVTIAEFSKSRLFNGCDIVLNASKLKNLITQEDLEDVIFENFVKLFPNHYHLSVQVFEHSDIQVYIDFEN